MKNTIIIIISIFLLGLGYYLGRATYPKPVIETIVKWDTVDAPIPDPIIHYTDEYKELYFDLQNQVSQLEDSISKIEPTIKWDTVTQTVYVQIPMLDYIFQDSLYKATVRGYGVEMLDMQVFSKTITNTVYPKMQPWSITAGVSSIINKQILDLSANVQLQYKQKNTEYSIGYQINRLGQGALMGSIEMDLIKW